VEKIPFFYGGTAMEETHLRGKERGMKKKKVPSIILPRLLEV
jgi:hypothetical protein